MRFFGTAILLLSCCHQWATASYMLEITLHTYSNPMSQDSDGDDCEGFPCFVDCECDNEFTFCLRPSEGSRNDNPSDCSLGGPQLTDTFSDNDNIDFSSFSSIGDSIQNPVLFRGNRWPGGFLLFVQVVDDDTTDPDHVDDIFIDMTLATSSSFTVPQTFVGTSNNARLELSFRVQCSPGFTGADCTDVVTDTTTDTSTEPPLNQAGIIGGVVGGVVVLLLSFVITIVIVVVCVIKNKNDSSVTVDKSPVNQQRISQAYQQPVADYSMGKNPIYGQQISFDQDNYTSAEMGPSNGRQQEKLPPIPPTQIKQSPPRQHQHLARMSHNPAYVQSGGANGTSQMERPSSTYEVIPANDYTYVIP